MTMVACESARSDMLPPLFVVPGKRLNRDVLDASSIPGARITTAAASFMTSTTMQEWIRLFAADVPTPLKSPLVLVMDGAPSHMDAWIDNVANQVGVSIVQLPPNASHIY